LVNGQLLHGYAHPEMGHILLPVHPADISFKGVCPFHGTCLEGLASGPAIEARWNQPAASLPQNHPAWQLEAHYLALGLVNICLTLAPERIILGGGVMDQAHLLPRIRERVLRLLNNYIRQPTLMEDIDGFLVSPGLGNRAGVLGAIALAQEATLG